MSEYKCDHISHEDIERYLNENEKYLLQDDFDYTFLEDIDDKLKNCSICNELFEVYNILSLLKNNDTDDESLEENLPLETEPQEHQFDDYENNYEQGYFILFNVIIPLWTKNYNLRGTRSAGRTSTLNKNKKNNIFDQEIIFYEKALNTKPKYNINSHAARTNIDCHTLTEQSIYITEINHGEINYTRIKLASLYINRNNDGDIDKAIKYCDQVLAIRHNDPYALSIRGIAHHRNKNDNIKAINDLQNALDRFLQMSDGTSGKVEKPNTRNINIACLHYIIGTIFFAEGKIEEAKKSFKAVESIAPRFNDIKEILKNQIFSV